MSKHRHLPITDRVTDRQWARMMGTKPINRAAQQREHARERAELIAYLGMKPENPHNPYAATRGELVLWAREKGYSR